MKTKYLKYASGEIVLVVIGILIALSINNWNQKRLTRNKELHYLANIQKDLRINIYELDSMIQMSQKDIQSANYIISTFEGKPIENLEEWNYNCIQVQLWKPFKQSKNTLNELLNSGNLSLITNQEIKNELQNMEFTYQTILQFREHMRHDFEKNLYDPFFNIVDLNPMWKSFIETSSSNGVVQGNYILSGSEIEELLQNKKFKNGFVLALLNQDLILNEMQKVRRQTKRAIELIKNEIE